MSALSPTPQERLSDARISELVPDCDLGTCLPVLLRALGWRGNPRRIAEALPHFTDDLDLTALRNSMAILGYAGSPEPVGLADVDSRLMPMLYLPKGGAALVVVERTGNRVEAFDGGKGEAVSLDPRGIEGEAWFFSPRQDEGARQGSWFASMIGRFRPLFAQAFLISLLINVMGFAIPIFVMSVYDKVIGAGKPDALPWLAAGAAAALAADAALRSVRARILAFIGARMNAILSTSVFERLMALPAAYTESSTIGAQIARVKDFESIREFFTGSLASVMMDLPYALLHFLLIGILGGALVMVPISAYVAFAFLGLAILPAAKATASRTGRAGAKKQEFLIETLSRVRGIKTSGAEATWEKRYRDVSAASTSAGFEAADSASWVSGASSFLVTAAGVATIWLGVQRVMDGDMSMGGLIAAMMLVWKALSPLQTAFSLVQRVAQIRTSIAQVDNLMALRPERAEGAKPSAPPAARPSISFSRVSLRYSADSDPALVGASFELAPGELLGVIGRNGAGKSTILKLVLGMQPPQAGTIRIGGIDLRQIDPHELRRSVAYVPQTGNLFHGTIAQNLRLANPLATTRDLRWALDLAGAWDEIGSLADGLSTRVGTGSLPGGLEQKISLARAYVKRAPLLLLDEPAGGLDREGEQAFVRALEKLRGHTTIVMVTHRPSHLDLADRILLLDAGQSLLDGPAEQVRPRIPPDML